MTSMVKWFNEEAWTPEDTAAEKAKVERGKIRLEGWAEWQKTGGVRLDTRGCTPLAAAMPPSVDTFNFTAEEREIAIASSDVQAMEVDKILARWRILHRRKWKIVHTEFLTGGSSEQKAHRHGLKRLAYRELVESVERDMADALGEAT